MVPFCSASTSAASSTTGPRAMLIRNALGFISFSSRVLISLRVASDNGTTMTTKSASASSCSRLRN
ncbi:hypothetical protein D3C77_794410 [compost metagenome]